jgi:RecB family exonuclease
VDPAGPAIPPLAFHPGQTTRFSLPPEPELAVPTVPQPFPVTWFRAFIENPFLWALERVLGLAEVDDQAQEMDGGAFGDLAHRVLDAFGRSDELHSQDVDIVKARLSALLDRESDKRFGPDPLPAVGLQLEQLRARLEAFAQWQVRHLREGWRVAATEVGTPPEGVAFDVDGVPFFLSGRIDRVDHHPERGEWMVLDYKTGDADTDPERSHRRRSEWKDLQLPLYRHLLGRLEEPLDGFDGLDPVALGYLRLSKGSEPVRESLAPWTMEELESADEAARDVVRRLREGGAVAHDPSARMPSREGSLELLMGKWTLVAFERSAADGE